MRLWGGGSTRPLGCAVVVGAVWLWWLGHGARCEQKTTEPKKAKTAEPAMKHSRQASARVRCFPRTLARAGATAPKKTSRAATVPKDNVHSTRDRRQDVQRQHHKGESEGQRHAENEGRAADGADVDLLAGRVQLPGLTAWTTVTCCRGVAVEELLVAGRAVQRRGRTPRASNRSASMQTDLRELFQQSGRA